MRQELLELLKEVAGWDREQLSTYFDKEKIEEFNLFYLHERVLHRLELLVLVPHFEVVEIMSYHEWLEGIKNELGLLVNFLEGGIFGALVGTYVSLYDKLRYLGLDQTGHSSFSKAQVFSPINDTNINVPVVKLDLPMIPLLIEMNRCGFETIFSCCGHENGPAHVCFRPKDFHSTFHINAGETPKFSVTHPYRKLVDHWSGVYGCLYDMEKEFERLGVATLLTSKEVDEKHDITRTEVNLKSKVDCLLQKEWCKITFPIKIQ